MKLNIFLIACVAAETSIKFGDHPNSFLDSIYGPLVLNEDSLSHKLKIMEDGVVNFYNNKELNDIDSINYENLQFDIFQAIQKRKIAAKSHEAYIQYQSKLRLPKDDETSDLQGPTIFGGILTFGRFQHFNCFDSETYNKPIDIAIVGAPFDTGVSYRPGARFAPEALRLASRRLGGASPVRNNGQPNSNLTHINPYNPSHNYSIVDCGDLPLTPFDNRIALNQLYRGQRAIHQHKSKSELKTPKIITMGGDHTITLMTLKSAYEKYGPLNVIHFDSHIDTWNPKVLGGGITDYMKLNHGTFLHYAAEQGYLNTSGCFHVGLRAPYIVEDYDRQHDKDCGFKTITARSLDVIGIREVIEKLLTTIGKNSPTYISVDIDVLDPAFAPGTGTAEPGGLTSRELLSILDGLEGINLIGADVVEVSPPFDTNSEITSLAATGVIDSLLGLMLVKEMYP